MQFIMCSTCRYFKFGNHFIGTHECLAGRNMATFCCVKIFERYVFRKRSYKAKKTMRGFVELLLAFIIYLITFPKPSKKERSEIKNNPFNL